MILYLFPLKFKIGKYSLYVFKISIPIKGTRSVLLRLHKLVNSIADNRLLVRGNMATWWHYMHTSSLKWAK